MVNVLLILGVIGVCAYIATPLFKKDGEGMPDASLRKSGNRRICSACGKPTRPSDRFCPSCAARLR